MALRTIGLVISEKHRIVGSQKQSCWADFSSSPQNLSLSQENRERFFSSDRKSSRAWASVSNEEVDGGASPLPALTPPPKDSLALSIGKLSQGSLLWFETPLYSHQ